MVRCVDAAAAFGRHRAARPGQLLRVDGFQHCRSAAAMLMSQDVVATVYCAASEIGCRSIETACARLFARVHARLYSSSVGIPRGLGEEVVHNVSQSMQVSS